jgi:hypothetical protein
MREKLNFKLSKKIKNEIAKEDGITRNDVIRESLNNYLYFRKLNKLRNKMILKAQTNNIFTDDDIFNKVS